MPSARLEGYVPALSPARSTATRFLLGRPHPLHNDGPARLTQPSISSPALRIAIGRAYPRGMTPCAKPRHLFGALAARLKSLPFPKPARIEGKSSARAGCPRDSRQDAGATCRLLLYLSTVLISRLLQRYQHAIER